MKGFDSLITFLRTPDPGATHAFYNGLLGLPMVLDQGCCRIYRISAGGFLGFCKGEKRPTDDTVIITLVTDEVDPWFEALRVAGHHVVKPPAFNPDYNIYHCFVLDPSGYTVEIQRFEDPRWKRD